MKAADFFKDSDKLKIQQAVKSAEQMTSGEIRVYIEDHSKTEILDRAAFVFEEMNMHTTEQRNGVLIYIAFADRQFAVIGDSGIHAIVGQDFWESVKEKMLIHFKKSEFVEGITEAVHEAGRVLKANFPFHKDDSNELSDEVLIR